MNRHELRALTEKLSLDLTEINEKAGNTELRLTTLRDLDSTIDRMFEELTKLQRPELLDSLCPYFGVIWPAARALAEVVDHSLIPGLKMTVDMKIIELGCGLGLPALVAARKGAQTWAADFHPQVERFLALNREINGASSLRYVDWDWRTLPDLPESLKSIWGRADWVMASDVLYERDLPLPLAQAMSQAVSNKGRITLTDPGRPYLQLFCDELTERQGFRMATKVARVRHPRKDNPLNVQEVFVLDFQR